MTCSFAPMKHNDPNRNRIGGAVVYGVAMISVFAVVGAGAARSIPPTHAALSLGRAVAADTALLQRMLAAEDARVTDSAGLAPLVEGLRSADPEVRRIAARAIGRLERRENLYLVQPMLTDASAAVRAEAMNAVAQIAKADGPTGPNDTDARPRAWNSVRGFIHALTAS